VGRLFEKYFLNKQNKKKLLMFVFEGNMKILGIFWREAAVAQR
jgi:hypothetical protein